MSKKEAAAPLRVDLYIRVSGQEQAIKGLSLEAQQENLEEYARERGWVIVGVYIDAAKTARKRLGKRTNFLRMLEDVKQDKVDLILFTRLDRWFRSVADYYKVMEILDAHKCGWLTTQEQYDTTTAGGRLYINLRLSIAQNEADLCGERIGVVLDSKVKHGTVVSGKIPFGYRINEDVSEESDLEQREHIPQTSEERCKYIIEKLLLNKRKLNIFDLQYDIYVSEFTIKNDMKKISEMLEKYDGVELVKTGSHIYLKGSEESKRFVYKDLLANETKGNFINLNKIDELFPNFDLIKVKNILEEILEKYGYRVREETFPMLMIHVGVSIQRMMNYNYVETNRYRCEIRDTLEYKIAMEFFTRVTATLSFELNENEVVLFANLLIGRQRSTLFEKEDYLVQADQGGEARWAL